MRNGKLLVLLAMIILYGLSIIDSMFIPITWSQNFQNFIGVSLVIMLAWYFATWYRRKRSQLAAEGRSRSYWTLILGLVLIGISLNSIILVPMIWPNIGATGARISFIGFIVGSFLGGVLVAQWLVSKH